MENIFLFDEQYGVKWYKCLNCGALQRDHKPVICPICEGKPLPKKEANSNESKD